MTKNTAELAEQPIQTKTNVTPIAKNDSAITEEIKLDKKPSTADNSNNSELLLAILARMDKLEHKVDGINTIVSSNKDKPLTATPVNQTPAAQNTVEIITEPSATSAENVALLAKLKDLEQKVESMQKNIQSKDELIARLKEQNNIVPAGGAKRIPSDQDAKNTAASKQTAATEPSVMEDFIQILKTDPLLILEMIAAIALALGGWFYFQWFKKNKQKKSEMDKLQDYFKPLDLTKTSYKENKDASINDFLSNHHLLDIQVEEHEVDIGLQLEVFLSFSDYSGAEALMIHAIKDHPENDEYKLKLLDIFVMSNNRSDFDSFVEHLKQTVQPNYQEFWDRVKQMERALVNKNMEALKKIEEEKQAIPVVEDYKPWAKGGVKLEEPKHEQTSNQILNQETQDLKAPDTHEIQAAIVEQITIEPVALTETVSNNEIQFDIDGFDEIQMLTEADDTQAAQGNEIEFDLNSFNELQKATEADDIEAVKGNEIEFDLNSFDEIQRVTEANDTQAAKGNEIEFDINDFDEIEAKPVEETDNQTALTDEIVFNINDFDETEIQSITNASLESINSSHSTNIHEIEFDMSLFDDIESTKKPNKK